MRLTCPLCGPRDLREFSIMGSGRQLDRPAGDLQGEAALDAVEAQLYLRSNPAGRTEELWYHEAGCRQWLRVDRDTVSHAVHGARLLIGGEGA